MTWAAFEREAPDLAAAVQKRFEDAFRVEMTNASSCEPVPVGSPSRSGGPAGASARSRSAERQPLATSRSTHSLPPPWQARTSDCSRRRCVARWAA